MDSRLGGDAKTVNREVGTIHATKSATATFFRGYCLWGMIPLGVKSGGKSEDLSGAKLNADGAAFAALDDD
jgi:hypothetical protein